jgi:type II secretory pathway component PulF
MNLETLAAFNDEIRALTQAGIPLGYGLLHMRSGLSGQLHQLTDEVARRSEAGESLAQVLADPRFPCWYTAVVKAGIESGKLPATLESVARLLRRQAELRRFVFGALVYPVFVLCLACVLFCLLLAPLVAQLALLCRAQSVELSAFWRGLLSAANAAVPFVPWIAGFAVLALVFFWCVSGRALTSDRLDPYLPGLAELLRSGRTAVFLDVLALMLEAQLPLTSALRAAADATGSPAIRRDIQRVADQLADGQARLSDRDSYGCLPPLVAFSLLNDREPASWARSVQGLRDSLYFRVKVQDELFRQFFPGLALLAVGSTAAAAFCMLTLGPLFTLWQSFAASSTGGPP